MRGSEDDSQPAAKVCRKKTKICVKRAYHETSSKAHIFALLKEIEGLTSMGSECLYLVTTANRECRIHAITKPHNCNKRGRTSRLLFFFSPE